MLGLQNMAWSFSLQMAFLLYYIDQSIESYQQVLSVLHVSLSSFSELHFPIVTFWSLLHSNFLFPTP